MIKKGFLYYTEDFEDPKYADLEFPEYDKIFIPIPNVEFNVNRYKSDEVFMVSLINRMLFLKFYKTTNNTDQLDITTVSNIDNRPLNFFQLMGLPNQFYFYSKDFKEIQDSLNLNKLKISIYGGLYKFERKILEETKNVLIFPLVKELYDRFKGYPGRQRRRLHNNHAHLR